MHDHRSHQTSSDQTGGKQAPGLTASGAGAANAAPSAAGGSFYLEQDRIPVTSRVIACRCGCRSWFCPTCCTGQGISLKRRLIPALQTFTRVMMLTLTVDPQHFAGPREAFEHVKAARCLSVTMQALRRAGGLASSRWFCVIEWQANGWPHWHVLVDAAFIPFETLRDAWNVNLAKLGRLAEETRVGFGSVRFTVSRFEGAKHAAGYACAYLTKHPEQGYPEWVLASLTRKVHRYSTSRGFWAGSGEAGEGPRLGGAPAEPETDQDEAGDDAVNDNETATRRTISEQLAGCGEATVVLRETDCVDPSTGEVRPQYQHLGTVLEPLADLLARIGCEQINERGTRAVLRPGVSWWPDPHRVRPENA